MEPKYRAGDIVIVNPEEHLPSGICCVVTEDQDGQDARIRNVVEATESSLVLESLSGQVETRIVGTKLVGMYRVIDHLPVMGRRAQEQET
jgi:SOS-response transcriptional repressor LexA